MKQLEQKTNFLTFLGLGILGIVIAILVLLPLLISPVVPATFFSSTCYTVTHISGPNYQVSFDVSITEEIDEGTGSYVDNSSITQFVVLNDIPSGDYTFLIGTTDISFTSISLNAYVSSEGQVLTQNETIYECL